FEDLDGLATIESAPLQEGRNMSMLLGPSKEVDKLAGDGKPAEASATDEAAATATDAPAADDAPAAADETSAES
ncbi:MAG TPA: hypothetical protein VNR67_06160, partial [Solirubrobacterales bacterium]|nr:hypothetical protein [Solirubrobacterales bacterium]